MRRNNVQLAGCCIPNAADADATSDATAFAVDAIAETGHNLGNPMHELLNKRISRTALGALKSSGFMHHCRL